jgi:sec-independent protein translocase protein TatC
LEAKKTASMLEELANPWKDLNAKSLKRLRPVIIWQPNETRLVSLQATEGFMIWLKAGLVAGVVIGSPGIFWHIWQFFAAGLYPHERRYVYWYLPMSLGLFFAGVALAFFVMLKIVLGFLTGYTTGLGVDFTPPLTDYVSFALFLPLGFGIAFQLPLVMLGLHRFGVVSVELFISQWRIAILAIAFLSMILTPSDPYTMVGLAAPLSVLYFFGIFLCKYMPRGDGFGSQALDPTN